MPLVGATFIQPGLQLSSDVQSRTGLLLQLLGGLVLGGAEQVELLLLDLGLTSDCGRPGEPDLAQWHLGEGHLDGSVPGQE